MVSPRPYFYLLHIFDKMLVFDSLIDRPTSALTFARPFAISLSSTPLLVIMTTSSAKGRLLSHINSNRFCLRVLILIPLPFQFSSLKTCSSTALNMLGESGSTYLTSLQKSYLYYQVWFELYILRKFFQELLWFPFEYLVPPGAPDFVMVEGVKRFIKVYKRKCYVNIKLSSFLY